ncbi:MAG: hypothetical protein GWP59_08005 [Chlamydiales bacterium]|nr:hypothetical protein [Chlamydiales bacterium]
MELNSSDINIIHSLAEAYPEREGQEYKDKESDVHIRVKALHREFKDLVWTKYNEKNSPEEISEELYKSMSEISEDAASKYCSLKKITGYISKRMGQGET